MDIHLIELKPGKFTNVFKQIRAIWLCFNGENVTLKSESDYADLYLLQTDMGLVNLKFNANRSQSFQSLHCPLKSVSSFDFSTRRYIDRETQFQVCLEIHTRARQLKMAKLIRGST